MGGMGTDEHFGRFLLLFGEILLRTRLPTGPHHEYRNLDNNVAADFEWVVGHLGMLGNRGS